MKIEQICLPGIQTLDDHQGLFIYRGDLETGVAPGNKQHKLKYHLEKALMEGVKNIATFGGPYSNHIDAFVKRTVDLGLQPIVVVRGEVQPNLTDTLRAAVCNGAILYPSSRQDYKRGLDSDVKRQVDSDFNTIYWIPEGGSGPLGIKGCQDWAEGILNEDGSGDEPWDMVCLASGTGTTAAGFLSSSNVSQLAVFSALKGTKNLEQDIRSQALVDTSGKHLLTFDECYHGGFGKFSPELFAFLCDVYSFNPTLKLDPVYTGKMLYQVQQLIIDGRWPYRRTLLIHTGGLQGWRGVAKHHWPYDSIDY